MTSMRSCPRLQNVSTTTLEIRELQRTRVERIESANPPVIRGLSPEVTRHHQLEKIARFVFDSRLVHQPSLTLANERVSYGWQATRRLSTIARSAKMDGWQAKRAHEHAK